jgi:hypothetical protein
MYVVQSGKSKEGLIQVISINFVQVYVGTARRRYHYGT